VFLPDANGGYYLDEEAASEFLHRKRMRVMIFSAILLLLYLVLWACGVFGR
jgi:hypothetical protein